MDLLLEKLVCLMQGELWIKEYVSWFKALVKYGFELVNNQEKKAMKFAMGLNSPLGELILNQILYGATFDGMI